MAWREGIEVGPAPTKSASRAHRDSVRITSVEPPGWHAEPGRIPGPGEVVYCVEGSAEVVKVLGKTSDGSRLLELRLPDRPKSPFFAASSNVLVRDQGGDA